MKKAIELLNQLEAEGVMGKFALGGAVAAAVYTEPINTFDVDIFVVLPESQGLVTLSSIYKRLSEMGYKSEGDAVNIAGVPVQFLPVSEPLLQDALENAIVQDYDGVPLRIFSLEHLILIALKLGRPKDKARMALFKEADIDYDKLRSLGATYNLKDAVYEFYNS